MESSFRQSRISSAEVLNAVVNLRQLIFEVTDRCNLACKYCIYGDNYEGFDLRLSRDLSFRDAKAIIDYLSDIWRSQPTLAEKPSTVICFYGGEPLLNFTLVQQIVDYVRSIDVNRSFRFSMTSNCVLLDRYMDYLVEHDFRLLCSLDGDKKSNGYRVFHNGSSSFDIIYSNIKTLQDKYPVFFDNKVAFSVVLHNLNNIPEVYSFFKHEFNKVPELSEVSEVGFKSDKSQSIFYIGDSDAKFRIVSEDDESRETINRAFNHYIKTSTGNFYRSYRDLLEEESEGLEVTTGTCRPFGNKMFITVEGKILPCEQIPHAFSYGQVFDGAVSFNIDNVAEKFNGYLSILEKSCSRCLKKMHCDQCLYQLRNMDKGVPICKERMSVTRLNQLKKEAMGYLISHPEVYLNALK